MKRNLIYIVTETKKVCNEDGKYNIVYRRMLDAYDTKEKAIMRIRFDTDAYRRSPDDFTLTETNDTIIEVTNNLTKTKRIWDVVIVQLK